MLNKKLFLLIFVLLFGAITYSMVEGDINNAQAPLPLEVVEVEVHDGEKDKDNNEEEEEDASDDDEDEFHDPRVEYGELEPFIHAPAVQNNQPQQPEILAGGQNNNGNQGIVPQNPAPIVQNNLQQQVPAQPNIQNQGGNNNNVPQNQATGQQPAQAGGQSAQNQAGQNNNPPQQLPVQPADTRSNIEILNENIDKCLNWINDNKLRSLGAAIVGGLVLYKVFEKQIKERAVKVKEYCEGKFFDALIKLEEIKEDGLTKSDYIKGIVALLATGSLGGATYYSGIENSKNLVKEFFHLLKDYKIELCAGALGIAVARWLYQMKVSLDNRESRVLNFDNFLGQLTEEQRRIIFNSEDLLVAVGKGGDNHKRLLQNKEFMELLTPDQKSYLQNIVTYRCSAVRM